MCIRDRYGVEWDLLKLVESYLMEAPSSEEYRKLITACPSEDVYKRQRFGSLSSYIVTIRISNHIRAVHLHQVWLHEKARLA